MNRFARPSLLLLAACASLAGCTKPPSPSTVAAMPAPLPACEALILKTPDVAPLLTAFLPHTLAPPELIDNA